MSIVKKNKQVEDKILAKKEKMKMKYVQVQHQRKILQHVILRLKNPKTKLQKMAKKETIKSLQNEIFKNKLS